MDRQGFIGGTDAIRIMNGEWAELYQEKVGLVESKDLTDVFAVQLVGTISFTWLYKVWHSACAST